MHVPEPVISLSVKPKDTKTPRTTWGRRWRRFTKEDPTFRTPAYDADESNETVISGMGELQLEVYVERMKREYNAEVETGPPQVAYREAIAKRAEFHDYLHKKQTGGSGQYGRVVGLRGAVHGRRRLRVPDDEITGGVIPTEFIPVRGEGLPLQRSWTRAA